MWLYMPARTFFAKPADAIAACRAAMAPQNRDAKDTRSIMMPTFTT